MSRLLVVLSLAFCSLSCFACVCDESAGLCQSYKRGGTVFVAKVTSVSRGEESASRHKESVHLTIQESFGTTSGTSVVLENLADTDCSIRYRVGESYLIYPAVAGATYYTDGCMRILLAKDAADEIAHLRNIASDRSGAVVVGTLKMYAADRNFMSPRNSPIEGQTVALNGVLGSTREVKTDKFGRFAFTGLTAGFYQVRVRLGSEYSPVKSEPNIELEENGCSELDFRTDKNASERLNPSSRR
jgi:hypothetical protein